MRQTTFIIVTFLTSLLTYGQETNPVKGIATDKAGTPIPFCNVSVKGTKIAATTNTCGEFELVTAQNDFTIVFSCMSTHDFITFERRVKGQEINGNDTIVFQLRQHGKTLNKECQKQIDKKLRKLIVK